MGVAFGGTIFFQILLHLVVRRWRVLLGDVNFQTRGFVVSVIAIGLPSIPAAKPGSSAVAA